MYSLAICDKQDMRIVTQCLLNLIKLWDEIAPGTACPIRFTDAEVEKHCEGSEEHNSTNEFWAKLPIGRGGYCRHFEYQEMWEMFDKVRRDGLRDLKGEQREAIERSMRWMETGKSYNPR